MREKLIKLIKTDEGEIDQEEQGEKQQNEQQKDREGDTIDKGENQRDQSG